MIAMAPYHPGVPADVAAARAEIEARIAGSTLLSVYGQTVADYPGMAAHQWLDGGQWRSLTYRDVYGLVRDAALGLAALGLRPGEFAVIWARNGPEATVADYAVMHARAVPVFIYPTVAAEQAAYIASHCGATVAIVDREFVPSLAAIAGQLPGLREIIVIDSGPGTDGAAFPAAAPRVTGWPGLLGLGHTAAERDPGLFGQTWRQVAPEDLATLIYTSGTTGQPKAVMLTHRSLRYYQEAVTQIIPPADYQDADGSARLVCYLPMAHVTGRSTDHWAAMAQPVTLAYCPQIAQLFEVAARVHPTRFIGIPRVWEKLHASLRGRLPDPSPDAVGALPAAARQAILAAAGLDQCRIATSGAAPLDPAIIAFFWALGLPLTEGWGMSELSNAATLAAPGQARDGAAGRAFPGVEVRVAADGEVLVRGPLLMRGYYRDPELTAETIDADGWLHTGDIGELDADGYLRITDRKKELIITSGGKNVSPARVEYELQRHPLIGQACAIGDRRNYLTALLVLDPETAPAWARARGIESGSLAALAEHPEVLAEVGRGVAEANSHLARPEQVRRFRVLPGEWTAQTGELTPTLKRRRRVIIDRYASEIESLYP